LGHARPWGSLVATPESPDGSLIAFWSDEGEGRDIYVMDADGSHVTNLANSSAIDWQPSWSPDGSQIAFVSGRDRADEIYVMDADGSHQTRLTYTLASDQEPDWSPAR